MILGGDFNAYPESKVIQYLDGYFTRTCKEDCPLTSPMINPKNTIDYVMYKPAGAFKSLSTKAIDEKYASDHLPVVVELEVK